MTNDASVRLKNDLLDLLKSHPGTDKNRLRRLLNERGWTGISGTDINRVLYADRTRFQYDNTKQPPLWFLRVTETSRQSFQAFFAYVVEDPFPGYVGPDPRKWQLEAFDAWRGAGGRGIVEAVTGTGKTTVGILAVADAAQRGLRTLVVVPGRDLLDQWYTKLAADLPSLRIGRFGDRFSDSLRECQVVVATVQSACKYQMLPHGTNALLIADEVHRYGTESYVKALEEGFEQRLGLTATYERTDNGVEELLKPYFMPKTPLGTLKDEVVMRCGYERGLADGILARFHVGLLGVDFSPYERTQYDEVDTGLRRLMAALINEHGCPKEPFGEFMKAVSVLGQGGNEDGRATFRARKYLNFFSQRRSLLADSNRKIETLALLEPILKAAKGALLFTETVDSAERAAAELGKYGVSVADYTSKLDSETRRERLSSFRAGSLSALAAPKVLDEGVDIPEADVGVIVAASQSKRQMIQRMGRILRPKEDGRPACFIVLYVRGTSEDPELGAHDEYLAEMMDTAEGVEYFHPGTGRSDLRRWYDGLTQTKPEPNKWANLFK